MDRAWLLRVRRQGGKDRETMDEQSCTVILAYVAQGARASAEPALQGRCGQLSGGMGDVGAKGGRETMDRQPFVIAVSSVLEGVAGCVCQGRQVLVRLCICAGEFCVQQLCTESYMIYKVLDKLRISICCLTWPHKQTGKSHFPPYECK